MSWIDELFNSSALVYLLLVGLGVSIYLKKTGKTLPELIQTIKETINGFTEDKTKQ